jgi:hypothetical protein
VVGQAGLLTEQQRAGGRAGQTGGRGEGRIPPSCPICSLGQATGSSLSLARDGDTLARASEKVSECRAAICSIIVSALAQWDGRVTNPMAGEPMFNDDDLCPCASGLIVRSCTCKPRRFVPRVTSTLTPGPRTGRVVRRCYASPFCDCAPPISAEHPVSESALLEVISERTLRVFGERFNAQEPEGRVIGLASATKRVQCKRQQRSLGPRPGRSGVHSSACRVDGSFARRQGGRLPPTLQWL